MSCTVPVAVKIASTSNNTACFKALECAIKKIKTERREESTAISNA